MENPKQSIFKKPWVQSLTGIIFIILIVSGILFYKSISSYINIENSNVSSPIISVSPESQGVLDEVYVKEGDKVTIDQPLARIGAEILKSKVNGIIIYTNNTPGQVFNPVQAVIKMINPEEFRVIGTIKEDAGFSKISIGDPVTFELDAYPGNTYTGVIEEIGATSKDTSVVFSISDKREVKEFNVKVKYDISAHPEFKNGMSAKMKVYFKK